MCFFNLVLNDTIDILSILDSFYSAKKIHKYKTLLLKKKEKKLRIYFRNRFGSWNIAKLFYIFLNFHTQSKGIT